MLKYPVYVRSVTNLSDARYCAGMGVDLLGFCLDESQLDYVSAELVQGILGWTAGVKWVAEFGANIAFNHIAAVVNELKPDFISVPFRTDVLDLNVPIIFKMDVSTDLKVYPPVGSYLLLENSTLAQSLYYSNFLTKELTEMYQLIIGAGVTPQNVDEIFQVYKPYAIALKGGTEIAPGLKNFDHLAEILEAIEN